MLTNYQFYFVIFLISINVFALQFKNTAIAGSPVFTTIVSLDTRYILDIELEPAHRNATNSDLGFDIQVLPPLSDLVKSISNFLKSNNLYFIIPLGIASAFALWLYKHLPRRVYDAEPMTFRNLLVVYASVIAGVLILLTMGDSGGFTGTVIQKVGILSASLMLPAVIISLINRRVEEYGIKCIIIGFVTFASIRIITLIQL